MTRNDEGFASVVLLALSAVLVLTSAVAVALGAVGIVRHRAAGVADLAALAAADRYLDGAPAACAAARRMVAQTVPVGAEVARCRLLGGPREVVEIIVVLRPTGPLGALGQVAVAARAGR